jgi:ATP-dependent helicase/nuclease subunit A
MSGFTLPDGEARRIAQTEFGCPLVVEAGAGTGKTALLTNRVVVWVLGPGWERAAAIAPAGSSAHEVAARVMERVLAITFTEAAAAEMASRVGEALDILAAGAGVPVGLATDGLPPETERSQRAAALADEVHRLRVLTIHAACRSLLAADPLSADIHPAADVDADGRRLAAAVEEAVDRSARDGFSDGLEGWRTLATRGIGPLQVAAAVEVLVGAGIHPDVVASMVFDDAWRDGMVEELTARLDEFFGSPVDGGVLERASRGAKAAAAVAGLRDLRLMLDSCWSPDALCAAVRELDGAVDDRLGKWAALQFTKGEEKVLEGSRLELARVCRELREVLSGLADQEPAAFAAAVEVLVPLVRAVRERLRAEGALLFEDLLREALALLERSPAALERVRSGLDQVLVDEFQDTDAVQCRIVELLGLGGVEGPQLFVVGDPKQSIYGWRGADLAAYHAFVERVEAKGGRRLDLVGNFRSTAPVLASVTRFMAPVMAAETGVQAAYQELVASGPAPTAEEETSADLLPVEVWLTWPHPADGGPPEPVSGRKGGTRSADAIDLEAVAVADDIRRVHETAGVGWGEFAIMVRSTTRTGPLLEQLRARGIPFEIAREREYYRQREVVEASAFVRTALEPDDRLALLTVLRSGEVGVPDAALPGLWTEGFPEAVSALILDDGASVKRALDAVERAADPSLRMLPGVEEVAHWPEATAAAVAVIAAARKAVATENPHRLVARLRHLWLSELTSGARHLGEARQARLRRFWSDLGLVLSDPDAGPADVARGLRAAVEDAGAPAVHQQPDTASDRVHLFTIHGAKGLGFGHVYLLQAHREDPSSRADLVAETAGPALAPEIQVFGLPSPQHPRVRRSDEEHRFAERVRLLYVALTRAKRRLVVSGSFGPVEPREVVDPRAARSFADLLAPRVPRTVGLDRPVVDDGSVRFRIVTPAADVVQFPAMESDREALGEAASALRTSLRSTADARTAAGARQARPLTRAASMLARHDDAVEYAVEGGAKAPERDLALAAGTLVHRILEHLDLGDEEPEAAFRRAFDAAAEALDRDDGALEMLRDRVASGACLRRLAALGERVVARELPIVVAGDAGDPDQPLGAIVGSVDLVYRAEDGGDLVVADYKTDRVEGEAAIAERAAAYRPQLDAYASAVQRTLGLEQPPRTELWFLWPDVVV